MSSWRDKPTELLLGAAVVLIGVYFAVPRGNAQSVIYDAVGVGSAVVIAAGMRRNAPSLRTPWLLFALGNLCFAVADIIFNILVDPPVPSIADGFYLGGYPLLAVGLLLLLFAAGGHRRVAALGDAAIVTFAFILIEWVFVIDQIVTSNDLGRAEKWVAAAYPLMDIVLLAGLAGFFVSAAWRTPAFMLLVASINFLLLGDVVYGVGPNSYRSGDWVDAGWLLSYVLWAAAALHPSMRELSTPTRRAQRRLRVGGGRIAWLMGALLAPPAVLLTQHLRGVTLTIPAVVTASVAISAFVMLRLLGILRALERIRTRERLARADAEQAQRLLEAQNVRLVEADRMKDEFVALISHDLRTPLTSIMGYVELSLDEELGDDTRSFLEVVSRSSQRLRTATSSRFKAYHRINGKERRFDGDQRRNGARPRCRHRRVRRRDRSAPPSRLGAPGGLPRRSARRAAPADARHERPAADPRACGPATRRASDRRRGARGRS